MHWPAVASATAAICGTFWLLLQHGSRDDHAGAVTDAGQHSKHQKLPEQQQQEQQRRQQQSEPAGQQKPKKSGSSSSSSSTWQGVGSNPDIPQQEMQRLQSFLRKVYKWRGWQGGAYHITQAWQAVFAAAGTPAGGGWQEQFTGKQLTDANCDALLSAIDTNFCGGKLLRRMKSSKSTPPCTTQTPANTQLGASAACSVPSHTTTSSSSSSSSTLTSEPSSDARMPHSTQPGAGAACSTVSHTTSSSSSSTLTSQTDVDAPGITQAADSSSKTGSSRQLRCRVVQSWKAAWLAYFDTQDNTFYINCWRWAKEVSTDTPINCEGVVCVNRLQLLAHTLAHELVHAVVFHMFPDIDAHSPAYTVNSRHGPIFNLLNKQLFGHTSTALEHVHTLSGRSFV